MGGIDLLINDTFGGDATEFYLLDKDFVADRINAGFNEDISGYNSFLAARDFLIANGLRDDQLHFVDIAKEAFPSDVEFDLIISLRSWGFHYPISMYIDQVSKSLRDGGAIVTDIRIGSDGLSQLKRHFQSVEVLYEGEKHLRVSASG